MCGKGCNVRGSAATACGHASTHKALTSLIEPCAAMLDSASCRFLVCTSSRVAAIWQRERGNKERRQEEEAFQAHQVALPAHIMPPHNTYRMGPYMLSSSLAPYTRPDSRQVS